MAAATASSGIAAPRASSSGRSPSPAGPIAVSHDQPRNATGPSSHRQLMAEDYPGPLNLLVLGLASRRSSPSIQVRQVMTSSSWGMIRCVMLGLLAIVTVAAACVRPATEQAANPVTPTAGPLQSAGSPSPSPQVALSPTPLPRTEIPPGPGGVLGVPSSPPPGGQAAPLPTVQIPAIQGPTPPAPTPFSLPPAQPPAQSSGSSLTQPTIAPVSTPAGQSRGSSLPGLPGPQSAPIATSPPPPPVVQPTLAPIRPPTSVGQ